MPSRSLAGAGCWQPERLSASQIVSCRRGPDGVDHHQTGRHRQRRRVAGHCYEMALPIIMIGVGEGEDDLMPFNAEGLTQALLRPTSTETKA